MARAPLTFQESNLSVMTALSILAHRSVHKELRVAQVSAGILLYRRGAAGLEVFLVHMGGPFWANKDAGAWSIPKGLIGPDEDPLTAGLREFTEETGQSLGVQAAALGYALQPVRQAGGKIVHAWAVEGDANADVIVSNWFSVESPRGSGRWRSYPEVDRAAWLPIQVAYEKILPGQRPLLAELETLVDRGPTK
jgi:predicted NUDIX family NTP pyrophosphohydrolase